MPVPFDGDDIMFALFVLILLIIAFIAHLSQIGKNKVVTYSFFIVWIVIPVSYYSLSDLYRQKQYELRKHREQEANRNLPAFLAKSTSYFEEKCKSAGIFIYDENIPSQDSIYIMRPFTHEGDDSSLGKQYVVHDFFNQTVGEGKRVKLFHSIDGYPRLLFADTNVGFAYVETYLGKTYLGEPVNLVRLEYDPANTRFSQTPISSINSRYGTTWADISTKDDRDHWVAGGKRQIIDLQTNTVVAEAIGYVMANNPDIYNWGHVNTCPEDYAANEFVWSVLRSKEYFYFNYMQNKKIRKK